MADKKTFYLIDGNGYIHRAYHALPPLTNSRGEPVGALFGFARMLLKIVKENRPDYMAVCFDTAAPTFRHVSYAEYKATRKKTDNELIFQLPLAQDLVTSWGFPAVALDGFEADDVIATLARRGKEEGLRVVVVTADKDAMQLVDDDILVLNESRNVLYNAKEVEAKYGLRPDQMVDYFALTGDASDNVPGVPGVGPKTATQLLQQYGTLDEILSHAADLKGSLKEKMQTHRELVLKSRELVILDRKAPISVEPIHCEMRPPDREKLTEFFKRLEFNKLLDEILSSDKPGARPMAIARATHAPAPEAEMPAAVAAPPKNSSRVVRLVLTEDDFRDLDEMLASAKELSLDVETTGLDSMQCGLVGISLSMNPGEAWYIPWAHDDQADKQEFIHEQTRKILAPVLADPKLPKVGQNLKYDVMVLRCHGMPVEGIQFDTLIASYCLNPSRATHNLKDLARDLLNESMTRIEELIGKGAKQIPMNRVASATAADYAGADSEVALRLKQYMAPQIEEKKLGKLYYDVEMPLVRILTDMEQTGVRVDVPYLQELQRIFTSDIGGLEKEIYQLAGQDFNINSPKQLSTILFEKLQLPIVRKTKTGASTDEEVLRKLSSQHPLPAKIVDYRELAKLKSTYIDALLQMIHPKTDRVHTSFNQAVAATGRLSSSDPNLQNIPIRTEQGRRIRRAFIAAKGCVLLSADYSQIDLRVLAHVSGDKALSDAFRRGGDIHKATAREIFGLKENDPVTSDQRRVAKTVNFGIVYGQTAFGLSQQLGIPNAQARDYIDTYMLRYAGVKDWIAKILDQARRDGYVTTLLNRIRYLPEINASNQAVRGFAERTAMNTPIQGTSADIIKVAMRDVDALLREGKFKSKMLIQVHDELLFEVPKDELKRVTPLLKRTMEDAMKLDVPIVVDAKFGVNWLEMEAVPDEP